MTYNQALNAMSIGQMCRGRVGECGIIIAVSQRRPSGVNAYGVPYSYGDMFLSCELLGFGTSGGTLYTERIEDVMTEEEYQESLKARKEG